MVGKKTLIASSTPSLLPIARYTTEQRSRNRDPVDATDAYDAAFRRVASDPSPGAPEKNLPSPDAGLLSLRSSGLPRTERYRAYHA